MSDDAPFPGVVLPARLDRSMRLGPFASGRDALKFVGYAAAGALGALVLGPVAWLPFLAGGFVLTVYRPDGEPLDARVVRRVRYAVRGRRRTARGGTSLRLPPATAIVLLAGGQRVAGLSAGGVPVAFLPPSDARELFEGYGRVLREQARPIYLWVGSEPLADRPFRPPPTGGTEPDRAARTGYEAMVRLLCRRRHLRRVELLLPSEGERDSGGALLRDTAALARGLETLGIRAERLEGAALVRAVERSGWRAVGPG